MDFAGDRWAVAHTNESVCARTHTQTRALKRGHCSDVEGGSQVQREGFDKVLSINCKMKGVLDDLSKCLSANLRAVLEWG